MARKNFIRLLTDYVESYERSWFGLGEMLMGRHTSNLIFDRKYDSKLSSEQRVRVVE